MSTHRWRAVVGGASVAGLLAGRVLADYFDEVVVIDKGTTSTMSDMIACVKK